MIEIIYSDSLEALVEKHEENRPDKMVKYLELRKDIKNKHPLEEE